MSHQRIVLADDHAMIRVGLRAVMEQQPGWEVAGEAATGGEAIALVRQLMPDILVTDMVMPGLSGLAVVREVVTASPTTRIVVFSMHKDHSYVREALRAGALAYVLKESLTMELVTAIQHALEGRRYVSPSLTERILDAYAQLDTPASDDPYRLLTAREREVLVLTAQGRSSVAIAEQLALSLRTVENHRTNLMRKLDLHTIPDLVRYAIRRGLISLDD
ncbi:MAG: response regulator transcription factor [Chloroflexales bacterium]|nr:response regulator transcription factor [Chloroflexales bacterium]